MTSMCLNGISERFDSEEVFMLGYTKGTEGKCLRIMQEDGPYLNEDGIMIFQQAIQAPAFNSPVPDGGIPSSNFTPLNPNNGTGGGYLLSFVNPETGQQVYIDLFSGAANSNEYVLSLSSTGQLSMALAPKQKVYFPDNEITKGTGNYAGYASADVELSTIIGGTVPAWATHAKVAITGYSNSDSGGCALKVLLNDEVTAIMASDNGYAYMLNTEYVVPITDGKIKLAITTYNNISGTSAGNYSFEGTGLDEGFIRVAISGLIRADV